MSHLSLDELKVRIRDAIAGDPIAAPVRDIVVTSPDDPSDGDILVRIMIVVDDAESLSRDEARRLLDDVESAFSDADDRIPSIRFSEAA